MRLLESYKITLCCRRHGYAVNTVGTNTPTQSSHHLLGAETRISP